MITLKNPPVRLSFLEEYVEDSMSNNYNTLDNSYLIGVKDINIYVKKIDGETDNWELYDEIKFGEWLKTPIDNIGKIVNFKYYKKIMKFKHAVDNNDINNILLIGCFPISINRQYRIINLSVDRIIQNRQK